MRSVEYYGIRKQIKDGDIFLYNGSGVMSSAIHYFDNDYYNHTGIAFWLKDRLFTVEMWSNGIQIIPLSRRVKSYNNFCFLRPMVNEQKIKDGIYDMISKVERDIKYNYALLPRIALYKKTGIDLVGMDNRKRDICSELVQQYTNVLGLDCYKDAKLITPQDFLRLINTTNVSIFFDVSSKV